MASASVREIDVACRYGGEEFALILPETSRTGAFIVSERIRMDVKEMFARQAVGNSNSHVDLSVSGGIAIYPADSKPCLDYSYQGVSGVPACHGCVSRGETKGRFYFLPPLLRTGSPWEKSRMSPLFASPLFAFASGRNPQGSPIPTKHCGVDGPHRQRSLHRSKGA